MSIVELRELESRATVRGLIIGGSVACIFWAVIAVVVVGITIAVHS